MRSPIGLALVMAYLLLLAACAPIPSPDVVPSDVPALPPPDLPNGVAAGDLSQNGAVLWTRAAVPGVVTFTVEAAGIPVVEPITRTVSNPLVPVTVTVEGLAPGTTFRYAARAASGEAAAGTFRTPTAVGERRGLRFGVSGDWRGALAPYPALGNAPARDLDFFVAVGDTVYADFSSPAVPKQAQTVEEFYRKHAEVYSTRHEQNTLAALRASTAWFATIDDHEVLNNFAGGAPASSSPYFGETSGLINEARLYRAGLTAFLAYHPLRHEIYGPDLDAERIEGRPKLYRYRTFGSDAALFVLDMRSFRDEQVTKPGPPDGGDEIAAFERAAFAEGRTILGTQQLRDLQQDLFDAHRRGITWKFVVVPDPIQRLDRVGAHDRWQGYAAERSELLSFIEQQGIHNVVFIGGDIHGTVVNNLTYREHVEAPVVHLPAWEVTVGPVAFYAPYGPSLIWTYSDWGLLDEATAAEYWALPMRADLDDVPDDRDDFVKAMLNERMAQVEDDPVGLGNVAGEEGWIDVDLLQGDYLAAHTFGWTEFEIEAASQALTVTTYGIAPYREEDLETQVTEVLARKPAIVSQFVVRPVE